MGSPLPLVCQMESPIWSILFAAVSMMVSASSKVFIKIFLVNRDTSFIYGFRRRIYHLRRRGYAVSFRKKEGSRSRPP